MLTDFQSITQIQPYFDNPESTNAYTKAEHKEKLWNILGTVGKGVADIGGAALNFFVPGAGTAVAKAANMGINAGVKHADQHLIQGVNEQYNQQLEGREGAADATTTNVGNLDLSALTQLGASMKKSAPVNTKITDNAPGVTGMLPDSPQTGVSYDITKNLMNGGVLSINDEGINFKGGAVTVKGGKGGDDIALVDTTTGKDTGVRVSKGEKLVVSKDNLDALRSAFKDGDKDSVFDIMQQQFKAKPKNKGYQDGGLIGAVNMTPFAGGTTRTQAQIDAEIKALQSKQGLSPSQIADNNQKLEKLYQERSNVLAGGYNLPLDEHSGETSQTFVPTIPDGQTEQSATATTPTLPTTDVPQTGATIPRSTIDIAGLDDPSISQLPLPETQPDDLRKALNLDAVGQGTDSANAIKATNNHLKVNDYLGSTLGYLGGAAQLGFGLAAASQRLPTFTKPAAWNQYLDRLRSLSEEGLTAKEKADLQLNSDRTYAGDVSNIYNASGGNPGAVLGNLGRAASSKYNNDLNIGALNDEAKTRNLANYGSALGEDVNLDRLIFTDAYNNKLRDKEAGANLAGAGLQNIMGQAQTDKFYGPKSQYSELMNETIASKEAEAKAYQAFLKHVQDNPDLFANYNYPQTTK